MFVLRGKNLGREKKSRLTPATREHGEVGRKDGGDVIRTNSSHARLDLKTKGSGEEKGISS